MPYALTGKIEKELDHLEQQGVIEPVTFSEWAAPIVPVLKKDGTVRKCGDYKMTVNQAAKIDSYPLPKVNDLFASLAGGQTFSKLNLANAYLQMPLDKATQKVLAINTHKGLYASIWSICSSCYFSKDNGNNSSTVPLEMGA